MWYNNGIETIQECLAVPPFYTDPRRSLGVPLYSLYHLISAPNSISRHLKVTLDVGEGIWQDDIIISSYMRLLPVIIINWSLSYLTYARTNNVCGITMVVMKPFKSALQFPLFIYILGDLQGSHYILFFLLRPNAISRHLKVTLDAVEGIWQIIL